MATEERRRILERRAAFVQAALSAALAGCVEPAPATPAPGPAPAAATGAPIATASPADAGHPSPSASPSAVAGPATALVPGGPEPSASAAPVVVVRVCLSVIRPQLRFPSRRSDLDAATFTMLDEIAAVLRQRPEVRVAVEGHRDTSEPDPTLDERRAEAARSYLVAQGVPAERICPRGFDAERPVAPNTTPEGRAANRRVDFRVLEPDEKCDPAKP
ncbi:MAG: OmpA family protein [Polyangiaceae bacterium]|nr:OmpA family protein [Polyangiaceae bacterium]